MRAPLVALRLSMLTLMASNMSVCADSPKVLATSPQGTFRIEQLDNSEEKIPTDASGNVEWVVNVSDPKKRLILPKKDGDLLYDLSFSPDEQWIAANVHYGSRMAGFRLYRHKDGAKFEQVLNEEPAWAWLDHNKAYAKSAADMMRHLAWSFDSSRLLLHTPVGGEAIAKGTPTSDYYLYYNLRSRRFEITEYLRNVNRNTMRILQSDKPDQLIVEAMVAEPMDALPALEKLKDHYETGDARLNEVYANLMQKLKSKPDDQGVLRSQQREWIKLRDAGADTFSVNRPKSERPKFRQYFLTYATDARVHDLEEWLSRVSE